VYALQPNSANGSVELFEVIEILPVLDLFQRTQKTQCQDLSLSWRLKKLP
jgi:hypothetical protein